MSAWQDTVRRAARAAVILATIVAASSPAFGHPLGNFSISQYTAITIEREHVVLRYLVDMAEIPTFQEIQDTGLATEPGHPSVAPYLRRRVQALREGLVLEVGNRRLPLETGSSDVIFPPGAGGLPTLKIGVVYRARLPGRVGEEGVELHYRDLNFEGRAGWKEVTAAGGSGVRLRASSVPERDRSRELSDYPTDLLDSPPQILEARVVFSPEPAAAPSQAGKSATPGESGKLPAASATLTTSPRPPDEPRPGPGPENMGGLEGPTKARGLSSPPGELGGLPDSRAASEMRLLPNAQGTPRDRFTDLITAQHVGLGVVFTALLLAAALGGFHALEPGHGKTVVAAYLVGSHGTAWHAFVLGLIVTASHTAGVYLLGGVAFFASRYVVPERLYPWLGVASGLTVAALGFMLFLRRYAGAAADHGHGHAHGHGDHDSHDHDHDHDHAGDQHVHAHHGHDHHPPAPGASVSLRELAALGITGGIVPCPAALVVLLGALSMRRVGFGLLLIVAFSVGLAAVLIVVGLLMVYARRLMSRVSEDGPLLTRWLPLASSAVITLIGIAIAIQALITAGIVQLKL